MMTPNIQTICSLAVGTTMIGCRPPTQGHDARPRSGLDRRRRGRWLLRKRSGAGVYEYELDHRRRIRDQLVLHRDRQRARAGSRSCPPPWRSPTPAMRFGLRDRRPASRRSRPRHRVLRRQHQWVADRRHRRWPARHVGRLRPSRPSSTARPSPPSTTPLRPRHRTLRVGRPGRGGVRRTHPRPRACCGSMSIE